MVLRFPYRSLVVLVGASGSGKSSFGRLHFKPTEVVSSDYCRALVSDDESNQAVSREAFEIVNLIAVRRLALGRLTVIDATNLEPSFRRPYIEMARRFNFALVAIVLNLPEQVCVARDAARAGRQVGPEVIGRQHQFLRDIFRHLPQEGFRFVFGLNTLAQIESATIELTPGLPSPAGPV